MFTVSDLQMTHITMGDATGGGHMHGSADPTKSKFPATWSGAKIKAEVLNVANDPNSTVVVQANGRRRIKGSSGGIDITVIAEGAQDRIVTAWPD